MFGWLLGLRAYPHEIDVIDGDSINYRRGGWESGNEGTVRYRLAGYDSPELHRAKTENEAEWAQEAKEFLKQKIAAARKLRIKPTGRRTPHGDAVAVLFIDGKNASAIMIEAGEGKLAKLGASGHIVRPKWNEETD